MDLTHATFRDASRELVRAIRGRRSQVAFSRRLGYRSNVAAKWEGGQRSPTAAETLRACQKAGIDVIGAARRFHHGSAKELARVSDASVAAWLRALRGERSLVELARASSLSRYQVSRALGGRTRPCLPDFLGLVHGITGRLPEWVSLLVDIERIPSLLPAHRRQDAARRCAYEHPWSSGVLAALDVERGGAAPGKAGADLFAATCDHVAALLGADPAIIREAVAALVAAGVLVKRPSGLHIEGSLLIDTRRDPAGAQLLRRHWSQVSTERLAAPRPDDLFSYNVFALSRRDYAAIRRIQSEVFQRVRAIVAESAPSEVAALLSWHLMSWDAPSHRRD